MLEKREIGRMEGSSSRESGLMKSFSLAIRSILTGCSNEEFLKAFSRFSRPEQELLRRLYIQVVASLHLRIENEFHDLCSQLQVGSILDAAEQLVEEQTLDPLFLDKSNVMDVSSSLSNAKEEEIQYLSVILQKAEEQNRTTRDRIELIKAANKDVPRAKIL
ncbi:unnamed protein product [Linum tenue]|uniref:Uncharacterized protein n=1 Tax=Linum tenue TaxID=586396 RepID=A0AAV0JMV0_9ROSI|nr:unnamed protein product [Linum tenue]